MGAQPKLHLWFKCPICGERSADQIDVPELDPAVRQHMEGVSAHYDVSCTLCGELFLGCIELGKQTEKVSIENHPEVVVETTVGLSHDDLFQELPPDNPYGIFQDAINQIGAVFTIYGSSTDGYYIINRMVFVQYIAAFEAYLAETLVLNVTDSPKATAAIMKKDKTLKEMKFGLADIFENPDLVRTKIRSYLRSLVYHRLDQVHALYKSALDVSIIESKVVGDALNEAIKLRHDCVHRNGFDGNGRRNKIFLPLYIGNVADILSSIVGRVEAQLNFGHVRL